MVDKKVLWNEGTAKLGGAQYNHILLQEYRPKGWEAVAILPEDGPLVEELEKHGVEVICIRSGPSWSTSFHLGNRTLINPLALFWLGVQTLFIAMPKYYFAIRKVHPDVVVTNSMIAHIFGRFTAFLTGKKKDSSTGGYIAFGWFVFHCEVEIQAVFPIPVQWDNCSLQKCSRFEF